MPTIGSRRALALRQVFKFGGFLRSPSENDVALDLAVGEKLLEVVMLSQMVFLRRRAT
jgi:hypothetical protein